MKPLTQTLLAVLVLGIVALSQQACSKRAAYDSIRLGLESHCDQVPDSEYADCMESARNGMSYDDYEAQRKEVIKGK